MTKCSENFVSQALGFFVKFYAAELRKQRIRQKIFRNRWKLNYSLGQIFEASRGIVFWVYPGNGFRYYLNYHDGKIIKQEDDGYLAKGRFRMSKKVTL